MSTTQEILDRLNAYADDNVWQDVIIGLDEYDEVATAAADPSGSSDRIVLTDGTVIRWNAVSKNWYEQS